MRTTLIILYALLIHANISQAQNAFPNYLDGVVYLKTNSSATINLTPYDSADVVFNQIVSDYSITEIAHPFGGLNDDTLDYTYKLYFEDTFNVTSLINEIELLTWVDYCEKAPLFSTSYIPNDLHLNQWYLDKIEAPEAWDISKGDTSVTIAVVDNAVRITHDDLTDNTWINTAESENGLDSDLNGYTDDIYGYDVANSDNNPNPPSGFTGGAFSHGSHCAGTASGSSDNGTGIAGVGFNCRIIGVKCTPDNSNGQTLPYAYEGLKYAIDVEADIVSMSWGGRVSSFTGEALINNAALNGIIMIAAAGNEDEENALSPASNTNVMAVGATDSDDMKASFSNYGPDIDIMAPGKSIYNLYGGNDADYGYSNGTSMACPIVAGAAGLLKSQFPGASPEDIKNALKNGCDDIDSVNPGYEGQLGSGRLNLYRSFLELGIPPSPEVPKLKIYPVPTTNELHVSTRGTVSLDKIEIIDVSGKSVTSLLNLQQSQEGTIYVSKIDLLEKGTYFIILPKKQKQARFIVQ